MNYDQEIIQLKDQLNEHSELSRIEHEWKTRKFGYHETSIITLSKQLNELIQCVKMIEKRLQLCENHTKIVGLHKEEC